jgi:hypothetical protein
VGAEDISLSKDSHSHPKLSNSLADGLPNAHVTVVVEGREFSTQTIEQSEHPRWNEEFHM